MKNITPSTLILRGKHDGSEPVAQAYNAFDHIATEKDKKDIFIFENWTHNPMLEEPESFAKEIRKFISKYQ